MLYESGFGKLKTMQSMFPVDRESNTSFCFPFQMAYMSGAQSTKDMKKKHVLAVIHVDTESQVGDTGCLSWKINLPTPLTAGDPVEVWCSQSPVYYSHDQVVSFARSNHVGN